MKGLPSFLPKTFLLITAVLLTLLFSVHLTQADCTTEQDCQNQLNQQSSQLSTIQQQQAALQAQLNGAQGTLNSTQAQLNAFQQQANSIQAQLNKATSDLNNAQTVLDNNKALFKQRVKDLYMNEGFSNWELLFIAKTSFADTVQMIGLKQVVILKNISLIKQYTTDVSNLQASRDQVAAANDTAQKQLAQIQAIRDAQAAQVASIQSNSYSLSAQIAKINSTIKNLSTQQQQIIAAKLSATSQSTTVGNSAPASSDPGASPYSPGFLFLNYGYPHRVGMNQYGAFGRANAGQGFQTILQTYYGVQATPANVPANITVNGCNDYGQCFNHQVFAFEDYLKHLYEEPSSWPIEALKAQAIAARTYAMRYGSTICPSQSCQEVKQEINATAWQQAVDATQGLVLGGNSPISATYSSTDGGYTCTDFSHNDPCTKFLVDSPNGVWDPKTAYDNGSPWFHKAWGSYNGTAWLSATDTADIFNAAILSQSNSSYNQYLSPQASGGWSYQRIIQELQSKSLPYIDAAAQIGVGMDGSGNTNAISVVGVNTTAKTLEGQFFRSIFDLRSPGTLTIFWSSLYDVQRSN